MRIARIAFYGQKLHTEPDLTPLVPPIFEIFCTRREPTRAENISRICDSILSHFGVIGTEASEKVDLHRKMLKEGSTPGAAARPRKGIFPNGQKYNIVDMLSYNMSTKNRHRFFDLLLTRVAALRHWLLIAWGLVLNIVECSCGKAYLLFV